MVELFLKSLVVSIVFIIGYIYIFIDYSVFLVLDCEIWGGFVFYDIFWCVGVNVVIIVGFSIDVKVNG